MMETRKITRLVVWIFYIAIAADVATLISTSVSNSFLSSIEQGTYLYSYESMMAEANAHDLRDGIISFATIFIYIACVIIFLRWTYKSSQITHLSGAQDLRFSPGWSVGWYFIPIASLWKPFQAFKQIYQVSIQITDWQNVSIPSSLRWWWGLFILSSIIGNILTRVYFGVGFNSDLSIDDLKSIYILEVIAYSIDIACILILIKIVKEISQRYNSDDFQAVLAGKPPEESSSEEPTKQESTKQESTKQESTKQESTKQESTKQESTTESSTENSSTETSDIYFNNRRSSSKKSSSEEPAEKESTSESSTDESSTDESSTEASDLYFDNRKRK